MALDGTLLAGDLLETSIVLLPGESAAEDSIVQNPCGSIIVELQIGFAMKMAREGKVEGTTSAITNNLVYGTVRGSQDGALLRLGKGVSIKQSHKDPFSYYSPQPLLVC